MNEYQPKHAQRGERAEVDKPPADRLEVNRQANKTYAVDNPAFAAFLELPNTDTSDEPSHLRVVFE